MISVIGSYLQLVQNFLQQNKTNKVNLLSLPPGALVAVILQIFKGGITPFGIKSRNVYCSLINNIKNVE